MTLEPHTISVSLRKGRFDRAQTLFIISNTIAVSIIQVEDHQEIAIVRMSKGEVIESIGDSRPFSTLGNILDAISMAQLLVNNQDSISHQ